MTAPQNIGTHLQVTRGRTIFVAAVVAATVALNLMILPVVFPTFLGIDFDVFTRVMTTPTDQLYRNDGPMPFIYPPTAILPFMAIGWIPYAAFALVSAAALFAAVSAACDRKVAALALLSKAAFKGLQLGQIPMLLAAGLFGALRLPPFAGGLVWGLIASIKPQLMIFAPIALAVRRDWAMLGGMAAGAAISFVASVLTFGFASWWEWYSAINAFADTSLMQGAVSKAITPAGVAVAAGYPAWPFLMVGGAVAALAVVLASKKVRGAELIALIVAASLAASPYGYIHDAMAIIPACVVLVLRARWSVALPGALIFFGTPIAAMAGLMWLLVMLALDGARRPRTIQALRQSCRPHYPPSCPSQLQQPSRQRP
jgi:hypothetical protein